MPPNNSSQTPGQRTHVSIFDRRGQKPSRGRTPAAKGSGPYTPGSGHRHDDSSQAESMLFNKMCMLRVHEDTFSTQDLVLNPSFFPGIRIGDIVAIKPVLEGDEGELASPRNSLDNDAQTPAAAAVTAGPHAGDSTAGSKDKNNGSAASGSAANGGTAADTNESGVETPGGSSVGPERPDKSQRNGGSRRPDAQRRASMQGSSHPSRSGRAHGPGAPRKPSRWVGMSASDQESTEHGEDDDTGGLRPDPHREILLQVGEVRHDTQQIQASMSNHVARTLWGEYATNQRVAIRKIDTANEHELESIRADFVEIAFRDQYVGRSDMWRLWRNLSQKVVHNNKTTNIEGLIRASVRRIYKNSAEIPCGFISGATQPIFRSESGRFIIFIQMSEEMWAYQEDGHLCFEKTVNSFLAELFRRWSEKQLNHMVTIVMFSRWYYHQRDSLFFPDLIYDEDHGRYYRDYYKVVADMEVRADWSVFLPEILAEFNTYRRDIQELRTTAGVRLRGDLSKAHQGNILEAINLGINSFSSNYVDRDLSRTGLSTIVVTPSFGVFDVSKRLLRMTTERMLHFGLRVDFVCLAPRPLFRPPVFRFKSYPVPTEQEQRRALGRAAQAERDARRAKETEISTVSPLAESPGPHSGGPPFSSGNAPKDRGPKVMVGSNSGHSIVIDPLMLDPLYFDDEKWVNELLPHVSGAAPRALFGGGAADGSRKTSGAHYSKQSNLGNVAADTSNSQYSASVISALIGDRHDIDPSEIPDTIKDLHGDQFPFFAQQQSLSRPDERAVYYYFAYWVDSGFYNYTDQSVAHHSGDFSPVCKMGELSVTGVANYMRQRPMIPDLDLVKAVNATAGADTDYTASIAGYDTRTMGSSSDSPGHDALRARSEEFRSAEAQMVAMARDVSHGRVLRSDRLSSVHGHERLLEMFAKFDRQAIVGTGTPWSANSTGNGASGLASGLVNTGSIAENRNTLGHIPTPLHLSQHSTAIVPSNASAHWDEQFGYNIARAPDSRATERVDIGVSSSAEPAEILPAVSSSASPNLRHSQYIKPPARSEHDSNMSSSVPRESKLSGHNHPGAVIPRTSVFMRSNPPAKRAVPAPPDKQLSDPVRHVEASSMDRQRHSIAGPSSLHDMNMQVPPRARGTTPDAGGARQGVHRVSESPQSIDYTRDSLGTINRSTSGLLATQGSNNERIAVSESIARQSHLEDHIRTFRGTSGSHEAQHHTQLPPAAQASATSVNAGIGPRHSTQEGDFQLTFPAGRQVTVPFSATTAPSQPSAPQAPDYHSGSPQYNKAGWLDRLSAHGPDAGTSRALHRRHYELYNPCNPERHPLARTELSQRWTYAFPTYSLLSSFTPKWRSLCTPASLPLVTDYYPTDLGSFYRHYFYHIKTPDINAEDFVDLPQEDYTEFSQFMATRTQLPANMATRTDAMQRTDRSTFIMLKEMVYQRLAQGFQFINMDCTMGPRSRDTTRQMVAYRWPMHSGRSDSDRLGVRPLADYTSGSMQTTDRSIWLSNGRQIQKLEFQDNSSSTHMPGVLVTRWERNKPFDQSDLRYRFQMWSRNNNMGYCADDTRFSYPMDEEVNWNNLDYLITGYRSNLTRAMRYWRTRYVLIPMEQLGNDTIVNTKSSPHMSNEDMRIANFEKFLDHILRLLRKDEKNKLEDRFLGLLPSELRRSTYVFGSQHDSSRRGTHRSSGNGSQPALSQQQQQQQFPAPPPQLAHAASIHDTRKAIGLSDLVPSSLMQVRYTTLYPVTYIANQLSYYMSDSTYLDPSAAIPLPMPAASVLGLADGINAESPFAQLTQVLQHPQAGLSLRNIRWHFGFFKDIFVGYQLVDWILVNFDSVTRRSQAVTAGNRLMERGVFRSPHRPGAFLDGYYFYEFTEAALRCKIQPPVPTKSQNSLMTSIGFADMVSRYGTGSNNPSPSASRPASRQGSNAPSLINDIEPSAAPATSAANTNGVTSTMPKVTTLDSRDARKQGPRPNSLREIPGDMAVDPRVGSISAQPMSRLRVRSDLPVSSAPTGPGTTSFSLRAEDSTGSSSTSVGRRGADADHERQRLAGDGQRVPGSSSGHSVHGDAQTAPSLQGVAFEFERTPDIFPEQLRGNSRRPLPKSLHQSRAFALDLDQQRRSTRFEQCVVHLDAVHNPTTCFHLSVNWLNCTNHLVDELVRGWARMAERCGMRLVEAPRAQDTSAEDNHPFHSPIRIALAAPPPHVSRIFDPEWVSEFALFGADDAEMDDCDSSEPGDCDSMEPSMDVGGDAAQARDPAAQRRHTRVLKRMARCIPTFPFERELLEEQDFVLDVEAEASHPPSSLMGREYTYDRAGHQYTQYVHRSGTAFVQICGPGQFLWLNNYLYTSHQSHVRPPAQSQSNATSLAAGALQMSLGSYSTRSEASSVTPAAGSVPDMSAASTPASRQLGRLAHSTSGGGRVANGNTGHDTDAYLPSNRAAPVYYPMRPSRAMWPHQVLSSLARNRSPERRLEIPDEYSAQIVDDLGKLPADYDAVNAAVTRVAVMRAASGMEHGSRDVAHRRGSHAGLVNERRDWREPASGSPSGVSQTDAGPDALRANFIEICKDKNSLEMFWQQTIRRYRNGWRDIKTMQLAAGEPQRSKPMVVDMFSEAMWQQRRHMPPTT